MRYTKRNRRHVAPAALLEALEGREHLSLTNFPDIAQLTSPNHTVVRLQTNFGDIDFEMFDDAAPGTVANFLKYVRDGDFDGSFFHRYATTDPNPNDNDPTEVPFVLQGGNERLTGPVTTGTLTAAGGTGTETIPTNGTIQNEFNQTNATRTVAMARIGGQPNSATSQFFINLRNNSFLDNADNGNGFTVFARVANDASWAVVQSIISGVTRPLQGQSGVNAEVPVKTGAGFTGSNVTGEQLVTIRDAEIIKPQGVAAFYTYRIYYPEGFAGSTINEFLPLGNPGSSEVFYQVVVRSEVRDARPSGNADFWYRDKIATTGSIQGNRRGGATISTSASPSGNLVPRQGMPYAYEVWATGPITGMLSHYDFGSSTIEAFTNTPATKWTIPEVRKGASINDFVVWQNTTELPATLTLRFYKSDGSAPVEITATTEAFRRGGLNIAATAALAGDQTYSLQITSDQPIVAAVTQYKTAGTDKGGATSLGITGDGGRYAFLPVANNGATGSNIADRIALFNPGGTAAIVTLIARFDDGSPDVTITSGAGSIIPAGARSTFQMPDIDGLRGKSFSVIARTSADAIRIYASAVHTEHGDVAGNPFAYTAATRHDFGEGFMNAQRAGTDLFETLAVFNPNAAVFGATDQQASVTVRFLFTDGFVLTQDLTVDAGGRAQLDLHALTALLNQNQNGRFYYSIEVVSDVPVIAMMRHYDLSLGTSNPAGGDSTIGTQRGTVVDVADL